MIKNMPSYFSGTALFVLGICGCLLSNTASGETWIIKDGQPKAEIVISDKPARMVKLAAEELQTYLEKISGAKLPIATEPTNAIPVKIYVGQSKYTDVLKLSDDGLKHGAFRMESGRNWLVLLGHDVEFTPPKPYMIGHGDRARTLKEWDSLTGENWGLPYWELFKNHNKELGWELDERGSLNAVYEFLRLQGVRWYLPDPLGEIVPQKQSIELPKISKTVRPDFALRFPYQYCRRFGEGPSRDEVLWQMRLGFNLAPELVGVGYLGHGIAYVMDRDEVKITHPEYYALRDGKRDTSYPCLSSPGLFKSNVKFVRAMFDIYHAPMVSVMPQDGFYAGTVCQCNECKGKATPDRGYSGEHSDYVWDYVDRVAREVYKTHPDRKIINFAYATYRLPPAKINELSPNVVVGICLSHCDSYNPEGLRSAVEFRKGWLDKLPEGHNELLTYDYYLYDRPGTSSEFMPVFFPHAIAGDLRSLKGLSMGEYIEVYRDWTGKAALGTLGITHLNLYVTSRFWWDADQDVDVLLDEYYTLFYGPAAREMKSFIEYSENHWRTLNSSVKDLDKTLELLAAARQSAGDTVYGKRIELIANDIRPLAELRDRLTKGREKGLPRARAARELTMANFKLDGKLDDKTWEWVEAYGLSELETGTVPDMRTSFKAGWGNESFYFGIRCEERDTKKLNITAAKPGDTNLFSGDFVELLIETQGHSYYRIAIDPAGTVVNTDRKNGTNFLWASGAEVATFVGDGFWSVEIHLPVAGDQQETLDPHSGVSGRKPSPMYPWFINVCRQRVRPLETQRSAFSPTGKSNFDEVIKFGELHVR